MNHDALVLTIIPDKYHIHFAGKMPDGRQVWVTPEIVFDTQPTRDFVNTYIWDADGNFLEARIQEIGKRGEYDNELAGDIYQSAIDAWDGMVMDTIRVKPFTSVHEGIEFGLIPETRDGFTTVTLMPGNCICFLEPFNGEYDT